ncbi:MAG TPA: hypothetical protein PKN93_18980, partial [Leptospiraceae bacterium]|nr:hypothetical protein [Leptospiraceae bacterium]
TYRYIDTSNDSVVTFGPAAPGSNAFDGGVIGPGGRIYLVPHDAGNFYYIDPGTGTVATYGPGGLPPGAFMGGIVTSTGRVYFAPYNEATYRYTDTGAAGSLCTSILLSGYLNKY